MNSNQDQETLKAELLDDAFVIFYRYYLLKKKKDLKIKIILRILEYVQWSHVLNVLLCCSKSL